MVLVPMCHCHKDRLEWMTIRFPRTKYPLFLRWLQIRPLEDYRRIAHSSVAIWHEHFETKPKI